MNYKKNLKYKLKYLNAKKLYGGTRPRANAVGDLSSFIAGLSLESPETSPTQMDETPSQEEVSLRQLPGRLVGRVVEGLMGEIVEKEMAPPPEDEEMAPPPEDEEEDEEMAALPEVVVQNPQPEVVVQIVGSKRGRSSEITPEKEGKKQATDDNRRGPNGDMCFSPEPQYSSYL